MEIGSPSDQPEQTTEPNRWHALSDFVLPSEPGNERLAMDQVANAVEGLMLPPDRLERLKTAVAEASLNAMEHGNHFQPDRLVRVQVLVSNESLSIRISDQSSVPLPAVVETPDLQAKLSGMQSPRGWGLFLIRNMVDEVRTESGPDSQTMELIMKLG